MPHLTIEYSGDLAASRPAGLLADLNAFLAQGGLFAEADIKSRLLCVDDWCVGTQPERVAAGGCSPVTQSANAPVPILLSSSVCRCSTW